MENKSLVTGGVIAAIIVGFLLVMFFVFGRGASVQVMSTTPPPEAREKQRQLLEEEAKRMTESGSEQKPTTAAGAYVAYSSEAVANNFKENRKTVLFFHAAWCPECKAADKAFTSRLTEIPADVTVFKTDYDTNSELKKKYAVTYQHTFVQIDADGNMITKWTGGDIESLKKYIK